MGRDDDVITSAGYRIGPGEIEDCLAKHPAVSMAAVVRVPDRLRTEAVKAFILLRSGYCGLAWRPTRPWKMIFAPSSRPGCRPMSIRA